MKKTHIHDTGFIAQIAEYFRILLSNVIPFQTNLTFPVSFFLKISARNMDMRLFTCNR